MVINIENKEYPEKLKIISNPPKNLYYMGDISLLEQKSIAIIGSRVCSEKGKNLAGEYARNLSNLGLCIISGMAKGIDAYAHKGSLEAGGKTIAVLGSGFNNIYPPENKKLFNKIIENNGLIITEYNPDVEVTSQGFVMRNRIVSALADAVLVIEAKFRSGTSITAEYASKQGKKVFCIAHGIEEKEGVGTNKLIQKGAILVTKLTDITKNLDIPNNIKIENQEKVVDICKEYLPVYNAILNKNLTADEISKTIKIPINKVNYILTMLEIEGYIEKMAGNSFKKKI